MNILVTICARAGSKGARNKNIRNFCDHPLVLYTLEAYRSFCDKAEGIEGCIRLALNTDSKELIEQMEESGVDYILVRREEELAGGAVAKFDVIKDTLLKAEVMCETNFDIVLDLDLTSPLRTWKDIDGTLSALLDDEEADLAYSVTDARRSPYFNMVCKKEDGYYGTVLTSNFVARQQTPVCYDMNASIYAYRRNYLLHGTMHKRKAQIWEMADTGILDIDSDEDFELMEVIFRFMMERRQEFREQFCKLFSV
ncbi:MAG: acylneuraminate cytidylyltransferase family protein [Lachnospiraceae bacterium]|nr:acylneuraminate cytidylyltransferase family protein [Lachnospiraceae bacterium]